MNITILKLLRNSVIGVLSLLISISFSSAASLTEMVESVLSSHEDIVNAKKELEEAGRDVTDAQLAYAPDLSVKFESGSNDKNDASSDSEIDKWDTWDLTYKQKIMDSGATLAGIRNKNIELDKQELEYIGARNDLLIEAADAYLGLIKASEKLQASIEAESNTRDTSGQEEIRVQVGSGLTSDVLKSKRQLASAQKNCDY